MAQPNFKFNEENLLKVTTILERYPKEHPQSAVMPLLDLAQEQNGGWLSFAALEKVADILQMPLIRVQEVATFYTMYRLQPVGQTVINVCTTTPCWLRGSDQLMNMCHKKFGLQAGDTVGNVSLFETECLGACVDAPVVQINDTYYEKLDETALETYIIEALEDKPLKTAELK